MTEELWELYRKEAKKHLILRTIKEKEKHPFDVVERITQDGIVKGILDSLEVIEGKDVFTKAFKINCELAGIDLETGFGTWETVKNPPKKDGWYLVTLNGEIAGEEKDFVGMCGFENGKWDEDDCVIAWMSLPEPARGGE